MVRANRIKEYNFRTAEITADNAGSGVFSVYTQYPLNGELCGISIYKNNFQPTGSIILTVSGVEQVICGIVSGTQRGHGIAKSGLTMPRGLTTFGAMNEIISGTNFAFFDRIPLNSIVHLVGSSVGSFRSGLGIGILYQ